jgi:hypothetical protein
MNWFELFYVCMKPAKVTPPIKCDSAIEHINVCITNDRLTDGSLTEGSLNYSESCNSIISELSIIDEE